MDGGISSEKIDTRSHGLSTLSALARARGLRMYVSRPSESLNMYVTESWSTNTGNSHYCSISTVSSASLAVTF